jgi:hypothetical protein
MNWGLKISKTLTISLYENYVVLRLWQLYLCLYPNPQEPVSVTYSEKEF